MSPLVDHTFAAASVDLDDYIAIPSAGARGPGQRQALAVFVIGDGDDPSTTAIEMALSDGTTVFKREQATLTAFGTARRSGFDGASGGYLYSVEFEVSGNHKLDTVGEGKDAGQTERKWHLGLAALATITSVRVLVFEITEV